MIVSILHLCLSLKLSKGEPESEGLCALILLRSTIPGKESEEQGQKSNGGGKAEVKLYMPVVAACY